MSLPSSQRLSNHSLPASRRAPSHTCCADLPRFIRAHTNGLASPGSAHLMSSLRDDRFVRRAG